MYLSFQILIVVSVSDWLTELKKKLTHRHTHNTIAIYQKRRYKNADTKIEAQIQKWKK